MFCLNTNSDCLHNSGNDKLSRDPRTRKHKSSAQPTKPIADEHSSVNLSLGMFPYLTPVANCYCRRFCGGQLSGVARHPSVQSALAN